MIAGLFPGQGSQTRGMGEWVARVRPDLHERACELAGCDLFEHAGDRSAFTQPAVYCASMAAWAEGGADAAVLAGHSLGEFAALAAAGALDDHVGLELVTQRGRLADDASAIHAGAMVAILGRRAHEQARELVAVTGLVLANDNSPRQVVLSGSRAAAELAEKVARDTGIELVWLPVPGAFHSPLMQPIVGEFFRALSTIDFRAPDRPVFSSVTARPFSNPTAELARALTSPVRWQDTVRALDAAGVERWHEVGPGRVLTGLVRRIVPGATTEILDPGVVIDA